MYAYQVGRALNERNPTRKSGSLTHWIGLKVSHECNFTGLYRSRPQKKEGNGRDDLRSGIMLSSLRLQGLERYMSLAGGRPFFLSMIIEKISRRVRIMAEYSSIRSN
jgi:hypothetical protein